MICKKCGCILEKGTKVCAFAAKGRKLAVRI